jgi:Ca-activated chloride channel homolog
VTDSLDAQLRDVPLPDGFVERLKASLALPIALDDEQLDQRLRSVAVPSGVLQRLHDIPAEEEIDQLLTGIPAPPALIYSLRKRTWGDRVRWAQRRLVQLALAATWFVAISASLAAMVGALVAGVMPQPGADYDMVVIYDGPFTLAAEPEAPEPVIELRPHLTPVDEVYWTALEQPIGSGYSIATRDAAVMPIAGPEAQREPLAAGPVGQWTTLVDEGLRPLDDAVLLRYGVLGSPQYADDRLPEMHAAHVPRAIGIEPPLARGYDRAFFLKHRVFPPISPAGHPELARLAVPLVPGSDVLGQLERQLAEGQLPAAGEIRTEAFLAAMDYRLPAAPPGRLALRTAAGPSPFGPADAGLLHVAVQAGSFGNRLQPATHLVLAIDLSRSMGSGGRLEMMQSSIRRLIAQLGPRDRLSLVVFQEHVVQVIEGADEEDAESLHAFLGHLEPRGGTNLAVGIQQGAALAMSGAADIDAARRLVLITDSQATMSVHDRRGIEQVLSAARDSGVRLDVLDVASRSTVDPLLAQWATDMSGTAQAINSGREMSQALWRALAGGDATIARDARLTITFNPQNVAAYRLIGHEANALAAVTPVAVETAFGPGEAAAALVELWLQGDGDDLGHAEVVWTDPTTGESQRARQRISRVQLAATLEEAPLPLVQAALAAQVGEVLRGAHDVLRQAGLRGGSSRGLAEVATLAGQANPRLRERPDLMRLLALVERLRAAGLR